MPSTELCLCSILPTVVIYSTTFAAGQENQHQLAKKQKKSTAAFQIVAKNELQDCVYIFFTHIPTGYTIRRFLAVDYYFKL